MGLGVVVAKRTYPSRKKVSTLNHTSLSGTAGPFLWCHPIRVIVGPIDLVHVNCAAHVLPKCPTWASPRLAHLGQSDKGDAA